MDYKESLEFLDSFTDHERVKQYRYPEDFKLDRMRLLAKAMGNPQNAYDSIIIAGSKGKGSIAAFTSSILRMDNYRVGLYTSPHLLDARERIRHNGLVISEAQWVENISAISRELKSSEWRRNPPTFFEILTVMAFMHFKNMKVHVAVLEVGLGGIYDSTNIAPAKVVGISPISFEHTEVLGKTLPKIAAQKAGVIKDREAVVMATQTQEVDAVIEAACKQQDAKLYRLSKDIRFTERSYDENEQNFDVKSCFGDFYALKTHLLGYHQIENAVMALSLCKALESKTRLKISESAIKQGIVDTQWPARLERLQDKPLIVCDGAHNAQSMQKALAGLSRHFHFSRLIVIFACMADKDVAGMFEALTAEAYQLILTQTAHERSMSTRQMSALLSDMNFEPYQACEDFSKALTSALEMADDDSLIFVTGSLYLAAQAQKALK